jgi:GDP-mannose 6-dehydrogenase
MRISVLGLGYVGCVTGACFAKTGHQVVGVDINEEKVAMVNAGVSPIIELGLGELMDEMVRAKRLRATCSIDEAMNDSDLALICVGTPSRGNGQADLSAIERVGERIGHVLRKNPKPYLVVLRSTVLPGTIEQVLVPAIRAAAGDSLGDDVRVAANPEFMREGSSLRDFESPPFTLVGCEDPATVSLMQSLYSGVQAPFIHTSIRTAEMVKYVANAFHALKICFANEIGDICERLGADPQEVMRIFLLDRKLNISEAYLRPGFAFGGSCLPKDLRALLHAARAGDLAVPVLSATLPSNDIQIRRGVDAVLATRKRRIGIVGLTFKSGTDDLRESPLVVLAETLIGKGCDVRILDRNVSIARLRGANRQYIEEEIPHIAALMCEDVDTLLTHAEVLVVGKADEEARRAAAAASPDVPVIDLTRGAVWQPMGRDMETRS